MFIDPSGHWPDWNKLVQGAILATVGVLTVAAVVATGGAATAVVALGYAALATAGMTLAIQGTAEVVESITGKNPVKDDMGENLYDAVMNVSLAVASMGSAIVQTGEVIDDFACKIYGYAVRGTHNDKYSRVVLGKFKQDGIKYTDVAKKMHATYFDLGDEWNVIEAEIGKKNMWYINREFLNKQIDAGKEILLSHDPEKATGFFAKEIEYLLSLGYSFVKDGDVWRAVK